jgi:hypothetical protein
MTDSPMADSSNAEACEPPKSDRRESDRTGHSDGVQTGGRRESDRARALPRFNAAKIAIACSFLFSLGLVAWAFKQPFRSGGLATGGDQRDLPEAELAKLEYEARLSPDAYVEYTRGIDRRLLDRVQDKYRQDGPEPPAMTELSQKWKERVAKRVKQLEQMREENDGEMFEKGTIEWQNQRELEKILDDAPPKIRSVAD